MGAKRMVPDYLQWWPVTGREANGHKQKHRKLHLTVRKNFSTLKVGMLGQLGLPKEIKESFRWRHSKPTWSHSCIMCSRWPCPGRVSCTRWSPEVPSKSNNVVILSFFSKSYISSRKIISPDTCSFLLEEPEVQKMLYEPKSHMQDLFN